MSLLVSGIELPNHLIHNGLPRWQIRLISHEPAEIDYTEILYERTLRPVMQRARTLIGRTSYMVNGPNREVLWSIERWVNDGKHKPGWVSVIQGKSTLRRNAKPQ